MRIHTHTHHNHLPRKKGRQGSSEWEDKLVCKSRALIVVVSQQEDEEHERDAEQEEVRAALLCDAGDVFPVDAVRGLVVVIVSSSMLLRMVCLRSTFTTLTVSLANYMGSSSSCDPSRSQRIRQG